jgi:hypothetical protein
MKSLTPAIEYFSARRCTYVKGVFTCQMIFAMYYTFDVARHLPPHDRSFPIGVV